MSEVVRKLYFGDNLKVLRESVPDESVDLIYLDPPFNSKQDYNVNFGTDAQIQVFKDTWQWTEEAPILLNELGNKYGPELYDLISSIKNTEKENSMSAYILSMSARLFELKRVLKPTGSIYLHCDPTAVHYLKVVMDSIFGRDNFHNDIIWKRTSAHSDAKKYGSIHDNILFYSKSAKYIWNKIYTKYDEKYVKKFYKNKDEDGRLWMSDNTSAEGLSGGGYKYEWNGHNKLWRYPLEKMKQLDEQGLIAYTSNGVARFKRYLDTMPGIPLQDLINDIPPLASNSKEKLDYPTQKPLALLERFIQASSNKGDVVLDPYCGCGTAIEAAEKLDRQWIGIDLTHLAIAMVEQRLDSGFKYKHINWEVFGTPKDLESAYELAKRDKYQFQYWACSLLHAYPLREDDKNIKKVIKKGKDRGIDGILMFNDEGPRAKNKKIIISVKGGKNITPAMVRDLIGTVNNAEAAMGLFVTLTNPTKAMKMEASSAGVYCPSSDDILHEHMLGMDVFPKIQIVTIEDLLRGLKPKLPNDLTLGGATFKKNRTVANEAPKPNGFNLD